MRVTASTSAFGTAVVAGLAYFASTASAQSYQRHNLTPDGFWHNRYHAILSMAAYGDYNNLCPMQTFTEAEMRKNFPNSQRQPWTLVSRFGPTPSGCQGFTAIVPEMNKALIVFQGNYTLEQTLPTATSSWDAIGLGQQCPGCTVNSFAAQGYMECKAATNNFAAIRNAWQGQGLVFSITGHGLGGMHSQIASADFNTQQIAYYSHAYGAPRVFNQAGATFYNNRFNGEAGERGVFNNDQYTEFIPEGPNYTHAGTPFYYHGVNQTNNQPQWNICWTEDGQGYQACMPRAQPGSTTTPEQDHYFYFSNVGQCGGNAFQDGSVAAAYIANQSRSATPSSSASSASATPSGVLVSTIVVTASGATSAPVAAPSNVFAASPSGTTTPKSSATTVLAGSLSLFLGAAVAALNLGA